MGRTLAKPIAKSTATTRQSPVAAPTLAAHPWIVALSDREAPPRDIADAVHLFCQLHGSHPTLIDEALHRCSDQAARRWLIQLADPFASQRALLLKLAAAVGPQPSTPGAAQTAAALAAQRHAIETLATSERFGCAIGAVAALIEDWRAIHAVLAKAAMGAGLDAPPPGWDVADAAMIVADQPAAERALRFGREQMHYQNEGLVALLVARASARDRL